MRQRPRPPHRPSLSHGRLGRGVHASQDRPRRRTSRGLVAAPGGGEPLGWLATCLGGFFPPDLRRRCHFSVVNLCPCLGTRCWGGGALVTRRRGGAGLGGGARRASNTRRCRPTCASLPVLLFFFRTSAARQLGAAGDWGLDTAGPHLTYTERRREGVHRRVCSRGGRALGNGGGDGGAAQTSELASRSPSQRCLVCSQRARCCYGTNARVWLAPRRALGGHQQLLPATLALRASRQLLRRYN